ncbi:hypothetical protein [Methylobacterium sp. J-030]|uniref:hypothetical protein n=1 Tax=Methylobacterium sp. J-030 TaxID=2836627 RepID=UPI001FBBD0E8|nr:hypothetical protein [Methylobacterium sp. J-030]
MNPGIPQGQTIAASKAVPGPAPNQYLPATPADRDTERTGGRPLAGDFDPLTGQPISGQPRALGATQGGVSPSSAAAATAASANQGAQPGLMDRFLAGLNNPDTSNLLRSLSIGLLTQRGIGPGLGAGLAQYQSSQNGSLKQQLEQIKFMQDQQGRQDTYNHLVNNLKLDPVAARAAMGNPTLLSNVLAQSKPNYQTVGGQIYDLSKNGGVPGPGNLIGSASVPLDQEVKKADALATVKDAHEKDDVVLQSDGQGGTIAVRKSSLFPDKASAPASEGGASGAAGADPNIRTIVPPQPDKKANEGLDKLIGDNITGGYQKAQGAVGTLAAISRQKEALDKGVISGSGADWRTQAQAIGAQLLGIDPSQLNASYNFDAASTQKQAELAKAVSQAGHTTNMDLQLGKTIAGGDRSKTEQALRQIVDAQETLARHAIDAHNASLDRYAKIAPEAAARTGFFHVDTPEVYRYGQGTPNPLADPGARLPSSNAIPSLDVNQSHEFNGMKIRRVR